LPENLSKNVVINNKCFQNDPELRYFDGVFGDLDRIKK
jgi:hypothetical protein